MFTVALPTLAMYGMAAVIGYLGVKVYKRVDDAVEARRGAAYKAAMQMRELGLEHTAEFYEAYAKGDYSGMAEKAAELAKMIAKGGNAVEAQLDVVAEKVLASKLASEAGRTHLAALLKQAEQPADPVKGPAVSVAKS